MATLNHFALTGLSGKIGELVFFRRRGRTCVRSVGEMKLPRSAGQLAQQARVRAVAIFWRSLQRTGVSRYWQQAAKMQQLSGYNLFMKVNVAAFTGEGRIGDFSKLSLTVGALQLPDCMQLSAGGEGRWILEWQNVTRYPGCQETDRLYVFLLKREDNFDFYRLETGVVYRRDCRAVFRLSPEYQDYTHLFCYFCSATGEEVSKSRYFLIFKNNDYVYF